jgi:hypothetical protein
MSESSYPDAMTRSARGDFDRLLDDIEAEAASAGPAAVRDLRALQLKYASSTSSSNAGASAVSDGQG